MKRLDVLDSRDLSGINTFLDGLKDPLYKARLKELEAIKVKINGLIAVHGKVTEIEAFRTKARQLKEGAQKLADEALLDRTSASVEIKAAKAASAKGISERESASVAKITDREHALVDGERALDDRSKVLEEANTDLLSRESDLALDMMKAEEIRTKYTEAVASLNAAIERTQKAL